jgi:hypothetical protein
VVDSIWSLAILLCQLAEREGSQTLMALAWGCRTSLWLACEVPFRSRDQLSRSGGVRIRATHLEDDWRPLTLSGGGACRRTSLVEVTRYEACNTARMGRLIPSVC